MSSYLAYAPDGPKQTLAEQLAIACTILREKYGLAPTQIRVPLGYGPQVPAGPYTVSEVRELHDRQIQVGPVGE